MTKPGSSRTGRSRLRVQRSIEVLPKAAESNPTLFEGRGQRGRVIERPDDPIQFGHHDHITRTSGLQDLHQYRSVGMRTGCGLLKNSLASRVLKDINLRAQHPIPCGYPSATDELWQTSQNSSKLYGEYQRLTRDVFEIIFSNDSLLSKRSSSVTHQRPFLSVTAYGISK